MFIEPIQPLNGLNELNQLNQNNTNDNGDNFSFKSVFDNALNEYIDAENQVEEDTYKLSVGETDDLHNLMINAKKAEMSLDLFLQLRNKAIDSYNEVMSISV
jgi:flagellar hook-basal body complex protein FliE